MRVITYEMAYWESSVQPNPEIQWDETKRYRSCLTGHNTFSFTTGTLPMDLEVVLKEIRRHFHEIVTHGKPCRDRDEAVERMEGMNTAEKHFTDHNGRYFRVFDVQHVVLVRVNEKKAHYFASQRIRYHGEYRNGEERVITTDDPITAPMTYHDNRDLCKKALNHLITDETITDLLNVSP
jgi:hypothetical protein